MTTIRASVRIEQKPWGCTNLQPWSDISTPGRPIGEIWFEHVDCDAPTPALLLKLLFTSAPLSIQVHPDDSYAQSIGLACGKTEAWYILQAGADAQIGLGLKRQITIPALRSAIDDSSIADLLQWQPAEKDAVYLVPAGTIHSIGAGLVIAEIQQRSDATFRLFDHGRQRELHVDHAVAAADRTPTPRGSHAKRLTESRSLLTAGPHFVLERLDLAPNSSWEFHSERESWFLVIAGNGQIETSGARIGDAFFIEADRARIDVGADGMSGLAAYLGPDVLPDLLSGLQQRDGWQSTGPSAHSTVQRRSADVQLRDTAEVPT